MGVHRRRITRHDDGWDGYGYGWRPAGGPPVSDSEWTLQMERSAAEMERRALLDELERRAAAPTTREAMLEQRILSLEQQLMASRPPAEAASASTATHPAATPAAASGERLPIPIPRGLPCRLSRRASAICLRRSRRPTPAATPSGTCRSSTRGALQQQRASSSSSTGAGSRLAWSSGAGTDATHSVHGLPPSREPPTPDMPPPMPPTPTYARYAQAAPAYAGGDGSGGAARAAAAEPLRSRGGGPRAPTC